jgi:ribosome-associated protein
VAAEDDVDDPDDLRSTRQVARADSRDAGERSAKLANTLMKLKDSVAAKLKLDEDVRAAVDTARRVTSLSARRRAERTLAGELRRADLAALEEIVGGAGETTKADARKFQLAEHWRTRLIEEGLAAAEELPGGATEPLPQLVTNARREHDTGKPPGAKRALFRLIVERLG